MHKVLVAMSGGVDSSVAALLLKKQGCDVSGVTMCLGVEVEENIRRRCCSAQAIEDARRISAQLGIKHYVWDFSRELQEKVIKPFIQEYQNGRTPNPCIECNRYLKFGKLFEQMRSLGFDYLATGHYARLEKNNGEVVLKMAKDRDKDQSYFLYSIPKENLGSVLFPLGDLTKDEVRRIAREEELSVYDKPQSQDICFIGKDYREFIKNWIPDKSGDILNKEGKILGKHKGIFSYTIGQREGLGISAGKPLYVIEIKPEENQIIVGEKKDLKAKGLIADNINILVERLPKQGNAKIRYTSKETNCFIEKLNGKIKIIFEEPQFAVTPGQSVVLYDKDIVLGGGIIESVIGSY